MARPKSGHPTELELLILKILWERSPLPVREIREALAAGGREIAHTSTITTLNIMVRKKFLNRQMQGNACLFWPRITHQQVSRQMLGDVVSRVFDGSASAVMLSLFDSAQFNNAPLDQNELKELRNLINQKLNQKLKEQP